VHAHNPTCIGIDKMCKAYCPGGIIRPISKPMFFSDGWQIGKTAEYSATEKYWEGANAGQYAQITRFSIELCAPIDACRGFDTCTRPYQGLYCSSCRFKYFREDTTSARCVKCGFEQWVGVFVMTVAMVFLTIGSLVGALFVMRFKTDLKFKTVIVTVVRLRIALPFQRWFETTWLFRLWKAKQANRVIKKTIRIAYDDAGTNLHYAKKHSIGVTLRLINDGQAQMLRILPLSVASNFKLKPLYELLAINHVKARFRSEEEALHALNNTAVNAKKAPTWPLTLTFNTAK
jgi:hypothetical protein